MLVRTNILCYLLLLRSPTHTSPTVYVIRLEFVIKLKVISHQSLKYVVHKVNISEWKSLASRTKLWKCLKYFKKVFGLFYWCFYSQAIDPYTVVSKDCFQLNLAPSRSRLWSLLWELACPCKPILYRLYIELSRAVIKYRLRRKG